MFFIVRSAVCAVAATGLLLLGACVAPLEEERPCTYCLAKSDFAGVWTYRIRPLDSEEEKSGSCSPERTTGEVRFEIHEDYLYAWLLAESPLAEACNTLNYPDCDERLVGAWEVRHYDLAPRCAEPTGEWISWIEENTYGCPWYERLYVQVFWCQNYALPFEVDRLADGAIEVEPLQYHVTSPSDPLVPEIDLRGTTGVKRLSVNAFGFARLASCSEPGAPMIEPECSAMDLGSVSCDYQNQLRLRQIFEQRVP